MRFCVWGCSGSIATSLTNKELEEKIETVLHKAVDSGLSEHSRVSPFLQELDWPLWHTAGGDTSCYEIETTDKIIILDSGTGIRQLGLDLMKRFQGKPLEIHILLSHTHWDHISGFPFFVPAYIPGNKIIFYGAHPKLKERLVNQQKTEYFPQPLSFMAADISFVQLQPFGKFQIGETGVENMPLHHPGGSYAYRVTDGDKAIVYATDSEYKEYNKEAVRPYIEFFRNADLLIFDAQYTLLENIEKEDWGHSNAYVGADLAIEADVKRLVLTHHEPNYDDMKHWHILHKAQKYLNYHKKDKGLQIFLAAEGLDITV